MTGSWHQWARAYSHMSLWTKVLFWVALFAALVFVLGRIPSLNSGGRREGFEQQDAFLFKTENGVYDDFYANVYDYLVFSNLKDEYEVGEILNNTSPSSESRILDIGCGTGHHVAALGAHGLDVLGIDLSPSMVKKAKAQYPQYKFEVGDALNGQLFAPESFTHILCMYFTIYYFRDKRVFFDNCFRWLMRGGYLVLHVVDPDEFDPILPPGNPLMWVSPQKYAPKRITTTRLKFDDFHYTSDFRFDEGNQTATFVERFTNDTDGKVRKNEHKLYMPSIQSIIDEAMAAGFDVQGKVDLLKAQYPNNYLYILVKPA